MLVVAMSPVSTQEWRCLPAVDVIFAEEGGEGVREDTLRVTIAPSLANLEWRQSQDGDHPQQSKAPDSKEEDICKVASESVLIRRDVMLNDHEGQPIAHLKRWPVFSLQKLF